MSSSIRRHGIRLLAALSVLSAGAAQVPAAEPSAACADRLALYRDLDRRVERLLSSLASVSGSSVNAEAADRKTLPKASGAVGRVRRDAAGNILPLGGYVCPERAPSGRTLRVGPNQKFTTLTAAVAASFGGDTILLAGGVYRNQFVTLRQALTIRGADKEKAHFRVTRSIPNRKGIIVAQADLTIENVIFSGANTPAKNGAGIRWEGGDLTIRNSDFIDNENGILGSSSHRSGILLVEGSRFLRNGSCEGSGCAHGIYISGRTTRVIIRASEFRQTRSANHLQSRALQTMVLDSLFDDGDATTSYAITLNDGGIGIISGNTIVKGPNAENDHAIRLGQDGYLLVENNRFVNHKPGGVAVRNQGTIPARVRNNSFTGFAAVMRAEPGSFIASGNRIE